MRTHAWVEMPNGVEESLVVEYDFQPAEPDVNVGADVVITGVFKNNIAITLSDDKLEQLTLSILSDLSMEKYDE